MKEEKMMIREHGRPRTLGLRIHRPRTQSINA
jgi:hypothetical protein